MRSLSSHCHSEIQVHGSGQSIEDSKRTGRFLSVVRTLKEYGKILGLFENLIETESSKQIRELFGQYKAARVSKDFKASDVIRKKLSEQGFSVQDTGERSILIRKR
jgi:cysteinyl-tRNA synthetase